MNLNVMIVAAIAGVALGALVWWWTRRLSRAVLTTIVVIAFAAALPWHIRRVENDPGLPVEQEPAVQAMPTSVMLEGLRPIEVPSDGYVASDACRECHPENHATWHASYHRTMTQVADPEIVLGNFDDVRLRDSGKEYRLHRDQDACWVEMPDPIDPSPDAARVTFPVVMTTGSHHMQVYWMATGLRRTTDILPFVFLNETQEWIPRTAAFLHHEEVGTFSEFGRWSVICSQCHSTHRRERLQTGGMWDTQVSEFGISCEACHGPGEDHILHHRLLASESDPQQDASLSQKPDPIVNPEDLSHVRSAQVCGQCHAVRSLTEDLAKVNASGHGFRPGDDLDATHQVWQVGSPKMREILSSDVWRRRAEDQIRRTYYSDGMIRVSGREYNGLLESACYQEGEMSCLSCHRLHQSESDPRPMTEWANDQLRFDAVDDAACLQCHAAEKYNSGHTHHEVGSSGSACYNCHMPHSTYGLLKAIRSHTICSPDIGRDVAANRPNACNQCHLDKTLQWSADHLKTWYDIDPPELDDDGREVAASLLWLLKGDAAERALAAWSMGWPEAQQISGTDWQAPFLAQLLDDSYPAVRLIARRSLRSLPGLSDLQADLIGSESAWLGAMELIVQRWELKPDAEKPALLIRDGEPQLERINRLLAERDESPIDLAE